MNIGPKGGLLIALREQNLTWKTVLGELIDNSFDADASRVSIVFGPGKQVSVTDNGAGCDNIEAMLTLGLHHRQSSTRLGRYGVGLKDAALWLWGETKITTARRGTLRISRVNWSELAAQQDWDLPDPEERPAGDFVGTQIVFRNMLRSAPGDYQSLIDELSYTFTPGLILGKQITFEFPKRKPVVAAQYQWPPLEHVVEDRFDVGGKGVRLKAGIVKEGHENSRPGFCYMHHHRVIMTTGLGANGFSVARVCGQVSLDDSWHLTKNKDDVSDNQDALGDAVFNHCRALLDAAQRQAWSLSSAAFNEKLTQQFREALAGLTKSIKGKRNPRENETGPVEPKNTGRRHRKFSKTQDGLLDACDIGSLKVDWRSFDKATFGEVDKPGNTIWLNESNTHLTGLRQEDNVKALLSICAGMYVDDAVRSRSEQQYFPGWKPIADDERSFVTLWSKLSEAISGGPTTQIKVA